MEREIVISFTPEGSASAMHFDEFDLSFLGERNICRASELKFNTSTQLWDIHLVSPVDGLVFEAPLAARGFFSYEKCRRAEVTWLQACRLLGVHPHSKEGIACICIVRLNTECTAVEVVESYRIIRG